VSSAALSLSKPVNETRILLNIIILLVPHFRRFAGRWLLKRCVVTYDLADQEGACFRRQRILELSKYGFGGDDYKALIRLVPGCLQQQLAYMERVPSYGSSAGPVASFNLEPSIISL
jgi:hypothetical protein